MCGVYCFVDETLYSVISVFRFEPVRFYLQ
jgi:hypothetical protein